MEENKIFNLRKSIRVLEREMALHLKDGHACCGVTLAQCHVLIEIGIRGGTCLCDISEHLGLDKSTLSRTVENLVQNGLVKREVSPDDRRYISLSLTFKGQEAFSKIDGYCNAYYQDVFKYIPKEKEVVVLEGIQILAEGFEQYREAVKEGRCGC